MKKYFFTFILALSMCNIYSQIYRYNTIVDTSLSWFTSHDIYPLGSHTHWEHGYFLSEDSMGSKKLFANADSIGELRDVNKRIIWYKSNDTISLFDFSLNIGDTLFYSKKDTFRATIIKIDTIFLANEYRKSFKVKTNWKGPHSFDHLELDWVEGVGDLRYGLLSIFTLDIGFGPSFCGMKRNNLEYLQNNHNCRKLSTIEPNNPAKKLIEIYPNPAPNYIFINSEDTIEELNIFSSIGVLLKKVINPSQYISLTDFSTGVYIVSLKDKNNMIHYSNLIKQ